MGGCPGSDPMCPPGVPGLSSLSVWWDVSRDDVVPPEGRQDPGRTFRFGDWESMDRTVRRKTTERSSLAPLTASVFGVRLPSSECRKRCRSKAVVSEND